MPRIHNFSAGPCTLPLEVLEQVREQIVDFDQQGMSLIEMSHRSKPVEGVRDRAEALVRELLEVPESHHVAFAAGGATMQFGMVPMNLLASDQTADYTHSGAWAKKAIADARLSGNIELVFDGTPDDFMTLPDPTTLPQTSGARYLHLTSNETIGGVQWKDFPTPDAPIVADMSSDILSRPLPMERFGLIYAGAQKNIGAAGITLLIIRDDVMQQGREDLPGYLQYRGHVTNHSMLNTPPVFQLWILQLVLEWLKARGGVTWAQQAAAERSGIVYRAIEANAGFYRCPVNPNFRSTMNVVFRLPSEDLEKQFVAESEAAGLSGLKGHRSVGGCRASLYNAMPLAGAEALADFMGDFAKQHG